MSLQISKCFYFPLFIPVICETEQYPKLRDFPSKHHSPRVLSECMNKEVGARARIIVALYKAEHLSIINSFLYLDVASRSSETGNQE